MHGVTCIFNHFIVQPHDRAFQYQIALTLKEWYPLISNAKNHEKFINLFLPTMCAMTRLTFFNNEIQLFYQVVFCETSDTLNIPYLSHFAQVEYMYYSRFKFLSKRYTILVG